MATFGASYTSTTVHKKGTQMWMDTSDALYHMLPEWSNAVAVVAPAGHGKSTFASAFGGYDVDDLNADQGVEREGDDEWDEYLKCMGTGVPGPDMGDRDAANAILMRRLARFFACIVPDSNIPVVYLHTAEMADTLGFRILVVIEMPVEQILKSTRYTDPDTGELQGHSEDIERELEVIRQQQSANQAYTLRHDMDEPVVVQNHAEAMRVVKWHIEGQFKDRLRPNFFQNAFALSATANNDVKSMLVKAVTVLRTDTYTPAEKAIAARRVSREFGDLTLDLVHYHHNHVLWADWLHRVHSNAWKQNYARMQRITPGIIPYSNNEASLREEYPLAAGNSKFAVCNASDWLEQSEQLLTRNHWSAQLLMAMGQHDVNVCTYERLLATLFYDKLLDSEDLRKFAVVARRVHLGLLPTNEYIKRATEAHNITRMSCTVYGAKIDRPHMAIAAYWNCLAGRSPDDVDIVQEANARAEINAPKKFFKRSRGGWSEEEFDERLRKELQNGYMETTAKARSQLVDIAEWATDFSKFLEHRKVWGKAGSATGAPRTDVYLEVPMQYAHMVDELTEEIAVGVNSVLLKVNRLRLNKSATFEFREFVDIVKQALVDYKPNSFTRYFTKKEVGRGAPRALFPATLMHYIVCSFVLHLAEKGSPPSGTRMLAKENQQEEDHWIWRELSGKVVGLMVDYASFNEQHTAKHLKDEIDALKVWYNHYNLLTDDLRWAIDWVKEAMDQIYLEANGLTWHFANGLLSGWRMTSWGNSWLNKCYLTLIGQQTMELTGEPIFMTSQTGGDDVASQEASVYLAHVALRIGEMMGFTFKAIKQMISFHMREFFRLFVMEEGVYGSLCRLLGSAASGQWSNSVIGSLVEPATKVASVIDVMFKIARRSDLELHFRDVFTVCVFKKWARAGEVRIAAEILHGTIDSGGRGVPMADGSLLELSGMTKLKPEFSLAKMVGLPHDASDKLIADQQKDARRYVPEAALLPAEALAYDMSMRSFRSAIASSQGIGAAQLLVPCDEEYYSQKPVAIRKLQQPSVKDEHYVYEEALARRATDLRQYKRAYAKYSALKEVVKEKYHEHLLSAICTECGTEVERVRAKDECSIYGFARVVLTEDYYDTVVWLSVFGTDVRRRPDETKADEIRRISAGMSYVASAYATDLWDKKFMYY